MNLNYQIVPDRTHSVPELIARVKAVNQEIRDEIRALVEASVKEGQRIAEAEAPRGEERFREGVRIRDAIRISETRYHPGGAGGGGFYEADLFADSALAPQIRYVFEGTAEEGRGLIHPARGNVLALQKEGEDVHFREWVHGQRPNTRWWESAREGVEQTLEQGIRNIK